MPRRNAAEVPGSVRAATLVDVAREAGVSAMTASAVLSRRPSSTRFSGATRQRVLEVAAALKYQPNANAKALVAGRANAIGVVACLTGDEPNLYFLELLTGVLTAAQASGYAVKITALDDWADSAREIPKLFNGSVDAVVLVAPEFSAPAEAWLPTNLPVVSVHSNTSVPGVTDLGVDEEEAAFHAVREILRLGHRRIVHLAGPEGAVGADRRLEGFLRAHREAGLAAPLAHVVRGAYSAEGGRQGLKRWLAAHAGDGLPHAVFCASDSIAWGCMDELRALGIGVPDEVSVVGFDDTVLARASGLTSVRQPLQALGHAAVRHLIDPRGLVVTRRAGKGPSFINLPTELVLRSTLRARPAPQARAAPRRGRRG